MASVVTVNDIINLLDEMAPPELAESWDNVGLMLGRRNKPVRKLLLALDMTQEGQIYTDERIPNYTASNPVWETIHFAWESQDKRGTVQVDVSIDREMYR